MLFSKRTGTEKTTSLLILGKFEGVPSSNSKLALASDDGTKATLYVKMI